MIDQLQMRFVSSSILIVYLRLACGLLLDVCGFPFGCCYRRHFRKIDSFLPILGSPASASKSRTISYKYIILKDGMKRHVNYHTHSTSTPSKPDSADDNIVHNPQPTANSAQDHKPVNTKTAPTHSKARRQPTRTSRTPPRCRPTPHRTPLPKSDGSKSTTAASSTFSVATPSAFTTKEIGRRGASLPEA